MPWAGKRDKLRLRVIKRIWPSQKTGSEYPMSERRVRRLSVFEYCFLEEMTPKITPRIVE